MKTKMKIGDMIIIAFILMITIVVYGVSVGSQFASDDQAIVAVSVKGQVIDRLDLAEDHVKVYDTEYGHNIVEIRDGKAYICEADCQDQICVLTREAEMNGDAVICLPNFFSLEVISREGDKLDAVSQ